MPEPRGGAGDAARFHRASAELDALIATHPGNEGFASALLGVAYGAASLRMPDAASRNAARALEIATRRGEGRIRVLAEAALEAASAAWTVAQLQPGDPGHDELAEDLVHALVGDTAAEPV